MREYFEANNTKKNNKKILKGTLLLYFRMFFVIFVTFVTTRELLKALGVVDFGLVNVIGSIISVFTMVSNVMSSTISRFFNYEIGRNDYDKLGKLFCLSLEVYGFLFFVSLIFLETVGVWVFNSKIVISPDKYESAFYFYQFSSATILIGLLSLPYISLIISHEEIKHFSWITMGEVLGKLLIVYCIPFCESNKLPFYGFLLACISALKLFVLYLFCRRKFPESRFSLFWNFQLFKQMFYFSNWTLFGGSANYLINVFINVFLNNFCGAIVNTARAISFQVATGISSLYMNLNMTSSPQIIKYWAAGECNKSINLMLSISRFGFYLVFICVLPLFFECENLLKFWLGDPPTYAVYFTQLYVLKVLISTVIAPLSSLFNASGKINIFYISMGIISFLNIPLAYYMLSNGGPAISVMYIALIIEVTRLFAGIFIMKLVLKIEMIHYFKLLIQISMVVILSTLVTAFAATNAFDALYKVIFTGSISVCATIVFVYLFGLNLNEKNIIRNKLKRIFNEENI